MSKKNIDEMQDLKGQLDEVTDKLDLMQKDTKLMSGLVQKCIAPFEKAGIVCAEDDPWFKPVRKLLILFDATTPACVINNLGDQAKGTKCATRRVRNILTALGWKSKVVYDSESGTNKRVWVCGS